MSNQISFKNPIPQHLINHESRFFCSGYSYEDWLVDRIHISFDVVCRGFGFQICLADTGEIIHASNGLKDRLRGMFVDLEALKEGKCLVNVGIGFGEWKGYQDYGIKVTNFNNAAIASGYDNQVLK